MERSRSAGRVVSWCLFVVWAGALGISWAFAQDVDTPAAVKARYEPLLAEYSRIMLNPTKASPSATSFTIKNNMVSKELKALLLKDEACAKKGGGVCNLDFDFLFNGQDACKPLKVVDVFPQGDAFILKVSNRFEECDKDGYYKPYDFTLVKESGAWVIDDAAYSVKNDGGKVVSITLKDVLRGKN